MNRRNFFNQFLAFLATIICWQHTKASGANPIITEYGYGPNPKKLKIANYDCNVKYIPFEIPWGNKKITLYEKCTYDANTNTWRTYENIYRDTSKRWYTPPVGVRYIHIGNGQHRWVPEKYIVG